MNLAHVRLQHEILNYSIAQLAAFNNIPIHMLQEEATRGDWKQWWPESDLIVSPSSAGGSTSESEVEVDVDGSFIGQSEIFLDRSKRRLAVYKVAKEMLMAQKYFELEDGIVDAALKVLSTADVHEAATVHTLGNLFKNLMSNSVANAMVNMNFGVDDGGLPTVIIRDLSGTKQQITG